MRIVIAVLGLLSAGCAMTPTKVPQTVFGKSVVVVSTIGDKAHLQEIATTVFQNKYAEFDTSAWGIRKHMEENAVVLLNTNKRFRASSAKFPITRLEFKDVGFDLANTPMWEISERKNKTRRLAKTEGVDLILLLAPADQYGDPVFGTNASVKDYGVYQRAFAGTKRAVTFATFQMVLYDGATGDEITWWSGLETAERSVNAWMETELTLSAAAESETQQVISDMYKRMLLKSFKERALIP